MCMLQTGRCDDVMRRVMAKLGFGIPEYKRSVWFSPSLRDPLPGVFKKNEIISIIFQFHFQFQKLVHKLRTRTSELMSTATVPAPYKQLIHDLNLILKIKHCP